VCIVITLISAAQLLDVMPRYKPVRGKIEILFCLLQKDQPIGGVQGLSMDRAVIDLGNYIFAHGQAYVALSRVRSLAGVLLSNFCEASLKKTSSKVLLEYERLRNMV
jgi:hypothetical protein